MSGSVARQQALACWPGARHALHRQQLLVEKCATAANSSDRTNSRRRSSHRTAGPKDLVVPIAKVFENGSSSHHGRCPRGFQTDSLPPCPADSRFHLDFDVFLPDSPSDSRSPLRQASACWWLGITLPFPASSDWWLAIHLHCSSWSRRHWRCRRRSRVVKDLPGDAREGPRWSFGWIRELGQIAPAFSSTKGRHRSTARLAISGGGSPGQLSITSNPAHRRAAHRRGHAPPRRGRRAFAR